MSGQKLTGRAGIIAGYDVRDVSIYSAEKTFFIMKQVDCTGHKRIYNDDHNRHLITDHQMSFQKTTHLLVTFSLFKKISGKSYINQLNVSRNILYRKLMSGCP